MNLKEFNSLTDLFFYQTEKQNPQSIFLEWLNPKNKKKFTWSETSSNIYKLAKILKKNINDGDRCLLVSENRPERLEPQQSACRPVCSPNGVACHPSRAASLSEARPPARSVRTAGQRRFGPSSGTVRGPRGPQPSGVG